MTESLIVVPLDCSEISERAIPYACAAAKAREGRLLLVTVWEGSEPVLLTDLPAVAKDITSRAEEYYQEYLAVVAKKIEAEGLDVDTEVLIGHPADEVLRLLEKRDPDLLVLATHGRSGISRWWYGSVANKLAREAPTPTLVIGPSVLERNEHAAKIERVLVPLDGSGLSESALEPALELADALEADVLLAQALRWATQAFAYGVPDADVVEIDKSLSDASHAYLERVKEGLHTDRPVETRVLHGAPAEALIGLVEKENVGLVVMTSHARAGLARAALGSVADRMLNGHAPVLLIRPEAPPAASRGTRGRYCHTCGRASPYVQLVPEDRCLRCGQHLRTCGNCVYFDGISCLIQRPEVHDTYPGLECPFFQFRETASSAAATSRSDAHAPGKK